MHPLFDKELQQKIINLYKNNPYNVIDDSAKDSDELNIISKNFEILKSEYHSLKFNTNLQYLVGENILELKSRNTYCLTHEYIKTHLASN